MRIDSLQSAAEFKARLEAAKQTPEAHKELARLDKATKDIESIFLKMMISQMRKAGGQGLLGKGFEAQMYSDFLDQSVAQEIASGGGVGIARLLYQRMEETLLRRLAASEIKNSADMAVSDKKSEKTGTGALPDSDRRTMHEN